MISINPDFDMNEMVDQLTQMYRSKGFEVTAVQMGNGISVKFSKDEDGIKKFVGLGLEITANFTVNNNTLMINFSNAEWTSKIIGLAVGWFLCLVPFITAAYGAFQQSELPKKIANDIQMLLAGGTMPFGT